VERQVRPVLTPVERERVERHHRILEGLYVAFPPQLRRRFLDALRDCGGDLSNHRALHGLYCSIWHCNWEPAPIPEGVALIFLDDPHVGSGRKCLSCALPLPEKHGHFIERATGKRVYSALRYFDTCPACGGDVASWMPLPTKGLPPMPNDDYDFEEQR
jgi:hypothetical protein